MRSCLPDPAAYDSNSSHPPLVTCHKAHHFQDSTPHIQMHLEARRQHTLGNSFKCINHHVPSILAQHRCSIHRSLTLRLTDIGHSCIHHLLFGTLFLITSKLQELKLYLNHTLKVTCLFNCLYACLPLIL